MKLLLCADARLGADCTENLGVTLAHKWKTERLNKFEDLIDRASMNNAAYIVLIGSLFGNDRIAESVIDSLFRTVKNEPDIKVLAFLNSKEYRRMLYRNDIPDNLQMVCTDPDESVSRHSDGTYLDEVFAARTSGSGIEIQMLEADPFILKASDDGVYRLHGIGEVKKVPSFEPIGFEDAEGNSFGYAVIECSDSSIDDYSAISFWKYYYETAEIIILPTDTQKEILDKINKEIIGKRDSILRITLTGKSPFGVVFNTEALEAKLRERVFFAEVYDNTVMSIDADDFENDISLRSEFVRLALQDESLSEIERNRIINCGWTALGNKGVPAK